MENFRIIENVPLEKPPVAERAVGHLATFGLYVGKKVGQGALLAYARVYDDMYQTEYLPELQEQFSN